MRLEPLLSAGEIEAAVARVAEELSRDYAGRTPLLVGVLKGSFVFLADLVRRLSIPCEVDFIGARSYGAARHSSGRVEITRDPETSLAGRHVVVVEDITDSGLTLGAILARIRAAGPASVRICALLAREGVVAPDYVGAWIGPGFVVGYGLDFAERYRELRDIRVIRDDRE